MLIMQIFNNVKFFTIAEVLAQVDMNKITLYRQINKGKIHSKTYMGQKYLSEQTIEQLKHIHSSQFEIQITKLDLMKDQWLKNPDNLKKLKLWSINYHTSWGDMKLIDYVEYWKYLLKPYWLKEDERNKLCEHPTNQWLMNKGFAGFKSAFEKRYLQAEGIKTLAEFWDYIKNFT